MPGTVARISRASNSNRVHTRDRHGKPVSMKRSAKAIKHQKLIDAFDLVKNRKDWKARIAAVVPAEKVKIVREAIVFFTGSVPHFQELSSEYSYVTAAGYRLGPCGDR